MQQRATPRDHSMGVRSRCWRRGRPAEPVALPSPGEGFQPLPLPLPRTSRGRSLLRRLKKDPTHLCLILDPLCCCCCCFFFFFAACVLSLCVAPSLGVCCCHCLVLHELCTKQDETAPFLTCSFAPLCPLCMDLLVLLQGSASVSAAATASYKKQIEIAIGKTWLATATTPVGIAISQVSPRDINANVNITGTR